ncbi:MAG: hypothetical protein P4L83_10155 [Nevskia sp.]|nr:hypothetical protein [Nevskia sp.]
MKKILFAAAALAACALPGLAAAQVGVSVSVGQPGFYGQINIGDVPQPPQVVYAQPVVIQPAPQYVGPPVYLHVPPGYERHWSHHCAQYNACGRPVYFVRDDWYNNVYVPHYHHEGDRHDEGYRHDHDEGRGYEHGHEHEHEHEHDHDH